MNPRHDKLIKHIWLTKAEIESLNASLKDLNNQNRSFAIVNIVEIIENAKNRGDFL